MNDNDKYNKLIQNYGSVVEDTSVFAFGISESLLPYPKEEIKQAILLAGISLFVKLKDGDEAVRRELDAFIYGYGYLSHFLPREKFREIQNLYTLEKNIDKELIVGVLNYVGKEVRYNGKSGHQSMVE